MSRRPVLTAAALAALVLPLAAGCVSNDTAGASASASAGAITVTSTADACDVSAATAPSGNVQFSVTNAGNDVTEFYLLSDDGLRVVSEVENIGPGLSRDLVVQVKPGTYFTACKPGMVGDGIRSPFTVTDSGAQVGPTGDTADQLTAASAQYLAYVKDQVGALLTSTQAFADAYGTGDDAKAESLYADARSHYERVEPVAESFGELDPKLDAREADVEAGQTWTGWHMIEKDLWQPTADANGGVAYVPLTPDQRTAAAADLVSNTQALADEVTSPTFTLEAFQIANGAKGLLDEVAASKVTGEEEIWSHTDLWDFQANVEGAKVAYEVLGDVVVAQDPDLAKQLDTRFAETFALLAAQGSFDSGFTYYDKLTPDEIKAFASSVDALSEPLSQLTTTVTGS
ncbi:iron uptake system protein EfeO [Cellulomonas sp. McL0617]|uniref:iron uptake system protein EfeO n=1 Tax=Cellulomonas sp. McL0617 TaxID=3415675 RepID=UPI003CEBBAD8